MLVSLFLIILITDSYTQKNSSYIGVWRDTCSQNYYWGSIDFLIMVLHFSEDRHLWHRKAQSEHTLTFRPDQTVSSFASMILFYGPKSGYLHGVSGRPVKIYSSTFVKTKLKCKRRTVLHSLLCNIASGKTPPLPVNNQAIKYLYGGLNRYWAQTDIKTVSKSLRGSLVVAVNYGVLVIFCEN